MEDNYTFEKAVKRLEEIVIHLENQDVSLEKTLDLFEEGIKNSGFCRMELDKAEKRVARLNFEGLTS